MIKSEPKAIPDNVVKKVASTWEIAGIWDAAHVKKNLDETYAEFDHVMYETYAE